MSRQGNKKLILIDPDPEFQQLFRQALDSLGIDVLCYASGEKALDDIMHVKPGCVVSEFITEDMDGRAFFQKILYEKEFAPLHPLPVILFSNEHFRQKHGNDLFDSGLRGWYTKPLGAHAIREIILNIFMISGVIQRNKELKQEVRRSEYRYRDLLENATDFIFTLDKNGNFVFLNNRFSHLSGYVKEDWLGQSFQKLIHPGDRIRIGSHYEMIQQGRARVFESRICHNENEQVYVSFSISPIIDKGTIQGAMGIGRDITEQQKMEQEILELKNFNESIIQSMEAGLLTIDLDGKITSLNTVGEKITGWHEKEITGRFFDTILLPEKMEFSSMTTRFSRLPPYSRETTLTSKSGKRISIGYTVTDRIDNAGKKVGTIISFRDMTELKQMQTELFRMDRLASLGVLASGIAHEIKNPLAGIKTMAQACEEEIDNGDPRREYLVRIGKQVNRLDELLKTFFAYARPKPPDRKLCPLSSILSEVFPLLNKRMTKQQIRYTQKISETLPKVLVDAQQMQQVFLNLIMNAIDAMDKGGEITIDANFISHSRIEPARSEDTRYMEVIVKDTGSGIAEEFIDTIFDPFFTTKSSGLGLGLSIVYRIIEEHHGRIWVESEIGKGTAFFIELPTGANQE
ncbi:PAS domain S-box protein [bacterium]|nr:PAS domain S-box protein [bacterium]